MPITHFRTRDRVSPLAIVAGLLLFGLLACNNNATEVKLKQPLESVPPTISARSPAIDETGITVNAVIRVSFDEAMRVNSFTPESFKLRRNGSLIDTTFAYEAATNTAVLTPTQPLSYNTTFTISLTSSLTDMAGNPLQETAWQFATAKQAPWAKIYHGNGSLVNPITDAAALSDGGYVVAGNTRDSYTDKEAFVARLDVEGDIKWQKLIKSETDDFQLNSVIVLVDGSYIAAGMLGQSGVILQFSSLGEVLRKKRIDPGAEAYLHIYNLLADADGGFLAVGRMAVGAAEADGYVLKFDKNVELGLAHTVGQADHQEISAIRQLDDGSYVAVGFLHDPILSRVNAFILGLDADLGPTWQKVLTSGTNDYFHDFAVSNGNYFIAGSTSQASTDAWLVRMAGSGTLIYSKVLDVNGNDDGFATVTMSSNGDMVFAGTSSVRYSSDADVQFLAVDINGATQWQRTFGGRSWDAPSALLQNAVDGFTAVGSSKSFSALADYANFYQGDGWVMRFDPDGNNAFSANSGVELQLFDATVTDLKLTVSNGTLVATAITSITTPDATLLLLDTERNVENLGLATTDIPAVSAIGAVPEGPAMLRINWTDMAGNELGYNVFRSEDGVKFIRHATVSADTQTYLDKDLSSGTTYFYKIVGFNSQGYSESSNITSATSL